MGGNRPNPAEDKILRRLRSEAKRIAPLTEERVALPRSGFIDRIVRPVDIDLLLDRAAADREQNLPYWAELWPSGIALADAIAQSPEAVRGRRVLELGSGLGVTAIAALRAGAELTVADYAPEALLLCRLNARRNVGREPAALPLNWRRPEPSAFDLAGDGFHVLLAADVLYEERDVAPLLALVERLVASGGLLWLAEPGRAVAARFLEAARAAGWDGPTETHPGPWPDPKDQGVVVGLHALRRSRTSCRPSGPMYAIHPNAGPPCPRPLLLRRTPEPRLVLIVRCRRCRSSSANPRPRAARAG